ncbi:unnamed protein product [Aureobasidium pullulans]|nr:unnamed protein product [Aureobasidium pullulans]
MVLNLGRSSGEQLDQQRKARAFLQENVKNDWSYPNAPHDLPWNDQASVHSTTSTLPTVSDLTLDVGKEVNAHILANTTSEPDGIDPATIAGWREREHSDGEDSGSDDDAAPVYETPESVGDTLGARKAQRRLRRQRRLERDMKKNIGLAHWSAQRNAWTNAQYKDSVNQPQPPAASGPATATRPVTGASPDAELLIPVARQLLPDNPIRSRISTSTYSDIYTKIILQGRTPSIPINLSDITRSLVQGWKEEGNWPPKPTPAEPSLVKKNGHPQIKKSLKNMGRILGIGGPGVPIEKGSGQGQMELNAKGREDPDDTATQDGSTALVETNSDYCSRERSRLALEKWDGEFAEIWWHGFGERIHERVNKRLNSPTTRNISAVDLSEDQTYAKIASKVVRRTDEWDTVFLDEVAVHEPKRSKARSIFYDFLKPFRDARDEILRVAWTQYLGRKVLWEGPEYIVKKKAIEAHRKNIRIRGFARGGGW